MYVEGRWWMWRKCGCGGRLNVEDGWWMWRAAGGGVEDTLLSLIMLFMLQLTHHANHNVDRSHTSHGTLVANTI